MDVSCNFCSSLETLIRGTGEEGGELFLGVASIRYKFRIWEEDRIESTIMLKIIFINCKL